MKIEFPPYPSDWIILEEELVDETFDPLENPPDGERFYFKTVKFAVIGKEGVGVNWSTIWLSHDCDEPKSWRPDPDSGGGFTFKELRKIVNILERTTEF
jgi:hypothetical protein